MIIEKKIGDGTITRSQQLSVHENVIENCWSEACYQHILWIRKEQKVSFVFSLKNGHTALSPFGRFLLNPSKEKNKHNSNKHCQVTEDQIFTVIKWSIRYSLLLLFFLQTDTTNTELKPLFGSSICKIESVFTEDSIETVPDAKGNSHTRPKRTHAPPTLTTWSYPRLAGRPQFPVPAWMSRGYTCECGGNLLPVSIQHVLFSPGDWSKSLPL